MGFNACFLLGVCVTLSLCLVCLDDKEFFMSFVWILIIMIILIIILG